MEEALNYQEIVLLVDSIDTGQGSEPASIDVNAIFSNRLEIKQIKYSEISQILERTESRRMEVVPEAQARQRPQPQFQPQPQPQQQLQPQPQPQQQLQPQNQQQPQVQAPSSELSPEMQGAASKLKQMNAPAEKEFEVTAPTPQAEKFKGKLVLPNLSLQDQISDLEKIEEGIDAKIFDRKQTKVIVQEVRGLSSLAAHEDMSRMTYNQKELTLMRNQRIKEIKGRLNIR